MVCYCDGSHQCWLLTYGILNYLKHLLLGENSTVIECEVLGPNSKVHSYSADLPWLVPTGEYKRLNTADKNIRNRNVTFLVLTMSAFNHFNFCLSTAFVVVVAP